MVCKTCGEEFAASCYELRATITRWTPDGARDYPTGAYGEGESFCSARCLLIRASRLIDDASGASCRTELMLTDAARARVRRATVQPRGWRLVG